MNTAQAFALFDTLAPVDPLELRGFWRGEGFHTGHPLDGLLESCHWLGKRFDGAEHVQPLVFDALLGALPVRPLGARLAIACVLRLPVLKARPFGWVVRALLPALATGRSQARLRTVQHRGVATATIVYDTVPIHDVLRRMDADTLLGLMDLKGLPQPLFFVLRRDCGDSAGHGP
jgi:hypothetical protein